MNSFAGVKYEGLGSEMLISYWGAELQQISSSERIVASADIKPHSFNPQTYVLILL